MQHTRAQGKFEVALLGEDWHNRQDKPARKGREWIGTDAKQAEQHQREEELLSPVHCYVGARAPCCHEHILNGLGWR